MRIDDIRDAADRENHLLIAIYGLRNASEIPMHMAISTKMDLEYRRNHKLVLNGFASDAEEIETTHPEYFDFESQHKIKFR
jgi:hypothetical protein